MDQQPVVIAEHLSRRFGDTLAVNDLTLEVYSGEIFGLLGHNGAGKTTTIRLLNGVLNASEGSVRVLGFSPERDGPAVRQRTGVLTETPSLYEPLTARANLTIFANLYSVPRDAVDRRVNEALETFELADRANEKVGGYSKGMKQRLALARAFLHQPDILFLDEPTAGLDPVAARALHDLILRLSREEGRTIFLCTHNLNEAQRLCQRVAVMEHGRLVALGTPAELSHRYATALRFKVEVAPQQAQAACAALHPIEGIRAAAEGPVVTVNGATREAIPDLLAVLINSGVRVYRVEPDEPSLEDVYFAIHDQEEGK